jgi:Raf kinase inhibitor-like YbhB/YbcL family protein
MRDYEWLAEQVLAAICSDRRGACNALTHLTPDIMSATRLLSLVLIAIAGCGRGGEAMDAKGKAVQSPAGATSKAKLVVTSSAFTEGQPVPKHHTGEGPDRSPPLSWSGAPAQTKEFALLVSDPDAPAGTWYHWVLYNLPASVTSLPEGLPRQAVLTEPVKARQGLNSWPSGNVGYRGPMPPPGHGRHRYYFTVYALDAHLELAPNLATPQAFQKALTDHVLAEGQLLGTYERK